MKEKKWVNGKMCVESELAAFNKQTDIISTGNVNAGTQRSRYIRPWMTRTRNDNTVYDPGEVLRYDMKGFSDIGNQKILEIIHDKGRKDSVILYEFFVWRSGRGGGRQRDVLGHVLTDVRNRLLGYVVYIPFRNQIDKRRSALFEAMNYVVDGWSELDDVERLCWKSDMRKAG